MRERVLLVVGSGIEAQFDPRREAAASGLARLAYITSIEDVEAALEFPGVGIIVILLKGQNDVECVDRVFWAVSKSRQKFPVIVVGESYDESDASLYLQMGAADYLSLHDHSNSLGIIVDRLLRIGGSDAPPCDLGTGEIRVVSTAERRPLIPSGITR